MSKELLEHTTCLAPLLPCSRSVYLNNPCIMYSSVHVCLDTVIIGTIEIEILHLENFLFPIDTTIMYDFILPLITGTRKLKKSLDLQWQQPNNVMTNKWRCSQKFRSGLLGAKWNLAACFPLKTSMQPWLLYQEDTHPSSEKEFSSVIGWWASSSSSLRLCMVVTSSQISEGMMAQFFF